jgi:hypothetical protein
MDDECDTNTDNGHQWCTISGNITEYEVQGKTNLINTTNSAVIDFINPAVQALGINNGVVWTNYKNLPNSKISFPEIKEGVKNNLLITGIGLSYIKNTFPTLSIGDISKISHIYYCELENLFKVNKWRVGDTNGDGPLKSLSMYQTDDMPIIGSSSPLPTEYVFINPLTDYEPGYALTDVYYRSSNVGKTPANAICFAFKKVLDLNNPKVYYSIINGVVQKGTTFPSGQWLTHRASRNGEFISQLSMTYVDEVAYTKTDPDFFKAGTYADVKIYNVGFKGFSSVKVVNFDPSDSNSFYNYEIDDVRCCNLFPDQQYGENTYEYGYCQNVKGLVVANEVPYSIPNFQCKAVLSNHCSKVIEDEYNIESELCGAYCSFGDTNCDNAIKGYCNSDKFYNITTGSNPSRYLSLKKLYEDEICGCAFSTTDPVFKSYPVTLQKTLEQRLLEPSRISSSMRLECTLPECKKSNYKLYAQKLALKSNACTDTEKCIGDGFVIPAIKENNDGSNIVCESYMNTGRCVEPPKGVMAIMPDPFTNTCKNILKGTSMEFPVEPDFCVLGSPKKVGGCVNNKQLWRRDIDVPGIPDNDPNWCPKPNEYPPYEEERYCIPQPPPKPPSDNNTTQNVVVLTVILFFIIFFIFFIIRLI